MYYIGIISGTSADAVDAALLRITAGGAKLVHSMGIPYPPALRRRVLAVDAATTIQEIMYIDAKLGDVFANAALKLVAAAKIKKSEIKAIGSHGQTLWHKPDGVAANTLQVGDPSRIAWKTGLATVADFRRMDMAAGGQGAPLVSLFHDWQFKLKKDRACVVNIGGISNITIPGKPMGYDIGPGNCLMDSWIKDCKGRRMDSNGNWAASGTVDRQLLQDMLGDGYFGKKAPKSTGREYFNLQWLRQHTKKRKYQPQNVQATLAQLTADSIASAVKKHANNCRKLFICGGGWHNNTLMHKLRQQLDQYQITSTATAGIPPEDVEAAAFAWLAWRRLTNQPGNAPAVTGASKAALLGAVYKPTPDNK
ncbi:MAG: anhydro-N-acetylmuramic acid kinase [Candidatus Porifericomitaceae bacterium WSBS_2022_MAG_OTU9]